MNFLDSTEIAALQAFWQDVRTLQSSGSSGDDIFDWRRKIDVANTAIESLTRRAASGDGPPADDELAVRRTMAQASIFETALTVESSPAFVGMMQGFRKIDDNVGGGVPKAPHQTMLELIVASCSDRWFAKADPTGVTQWLSSPQAGAQAVATMLKADGEAGAVAAMLSLLRDAAVPTTWPAALLSSQAFETLAERLPRTVWSEGSSDDLQARSAIQGLNEQAQARMQTLAAVAGSPLTSALPGVTLASGETIQAFPPAAPSGIAAVFPRGPVLSGAILGFFAGVAYAIHRKRKA